MMAAAVQRLCWGDHTSQLAAAIKTNMTEHADMLLSCQGESIAVHGLVLATASPYLADLISSSPDDPHDVIILDSVLPNQARQLVQFMYSGEVGQLSQAELWQLLGLGRQLQVGGILTSQQLPQPLKGSSQQRQLGGILTSQQLLPGSSDKLKFGSILASQQVSQLLVGGRKQQSPLPVGGISSQQLQVGGHHLPDAAEDEEEEDDVFESEVAVDLSPGVRSSGSQEGKSLAFRRITSINKISEALLRASSAASNSSKAPTPTAPRVTFDFGTSPQLSESSGLHRIKKPQPLTGLPVADDLLSNTGQPSAVSNLRTPRTPLLPSPDSLAIEERVRSLIDSGSGGGTGPPDLDRLRNLSVSSADFNFGEGGSASLPGTPSFRPQFFHIPESIPSRREEKPGVESLDLSRKRFEATAGAPPAARPSIPLINIIKSEPPDVPENDSDAHLLLRSTAPIRSLVADVESATTKVKVEPVEVSSVATTSRASPPAVPRFFFPYSSHHLHHFLGKMEQPTSSDPHQLLQPPHHDEESKPLLFHSSMFAPQQQHLHQEEAVATASGTRKKSANKQPQQAAFTCQKCGKSYNWNYNLNRHMRFECGIGNKFECSVCHKRFPYKQNAAIHLKRKHKLMMENADDMLAAGHILQMTGQPS